LLFIFAYLLTHKCIGVLYVLILLNYLSSVTSVFVNSQGFALIAIATGVWAFSHVQNTTFLASGGV